MALVAGVRERTIKNGGGTFDAVTFEPITRGPWAVGGARGIGTVVLDARQGGTAFFEAVNAIADSGAPFLGTWVDDGIIHIDAVDLIEDRQTAFDAAYERGELNIYNLDTEELVWVHGQDPAYLAYARGADDWEPYGSDEIAACPGCGGEADLDNLYGYCADCEARR